MSAFAASSLQADELVEMLIASACKWQWDARQESSIPGLYDPKIIFADETLKILADGEWRNRRVGSPRFYPWLMVKE